MAFLIVGAGLTGAVIARVLTDRGYRVSVVERRPTVGGNIADFMHKSGIRVHAHGPHYFRTSSKRIWNFVNRFAEFYRFEAHVSTILEDGRQEAWPVQRACIERLAGPDWRPAFTGEPSNFEEACLSMMPRVIYDQFIYGYTRKQWGVEPNTLSAALAGRFDVRDGDTRLKQDTYQGLPRGGYTQFVQNMLEGIKVTTSCTFTPATFVRPPGDFLIYTGPIDLYFDCRFGKLKYRTQRRYTSFFDHEGVVYPTVQTNFPSGLASIRVIEWKHMMEYPLPRGTLLTYETPDMAVDPDEYEYPFPDAENRERYQCYRDLADTDAGVLICGRLGEYRYYDMDQAIGRAMVLTQRLAGPRG